MNCLLCNYLFTQICRNWMQNVRWLRKSIRHTNEHKWKNCLERRIRINVVVVVVRVKISLLAKAEVQVHLKVEQEVAINVEV